MKRCASCNSIIIKNSRLFRGFDDTFCSINCRQEKTAVIIDIDPKLHHPEKWNPMKKTKSCFHITIDEPKTINTKANNTVNMCTSGTNIYCILISFIVSFGSFINIF